jgi:hypothetical protein
MVHKSLVNLMPVWYQTFLTFYPTEILGLVLQGQQAWDLH